MTRKNDRKNAREMALSKGQRIIEKYLPCGGFFSRKIMKFS